MKSRATKPTRLLAALVAAALCVVTRVGCADAGVLIPGNSTQPDPRILSLDEMQIDITIENGDARVFVLEIFSNHTGMPQEGNYVFALPTGSTVSDFAVWDGTVRIPAVILTRRKAREIYDDVRAQQLDPGLLEMGERTEDSARQSMLFSAHIAPIPAYGTKRLELEYHQKIDVNSFQSQFAFPLRPDAYQQQSAGHLKINFTLSSLFAIQDFQVLSKTLPLTIAQNDGHMVRGSLEGSNVNFTEDLSTSWKIDAANSDQLSVLTYRNPRAEEPQPDEISPQKAASQPGFFEASVLVGEGRGAQQAGAQADTGAPRNIVVLFDNSLSMQWEKLERSYGALEKLLLVLRPQDHFNVLLFNQDVVAFQPHPTAADPATVQNALNFVRASRLRGGTDLSKGLAAGLAQCAEPNSYIVLLSDGDADRGTLTDGKIAAAYTQQWKQTANRPRTEVFAVGDDANLTLMRMLAKNDGAMVSVLSTEPLDAKLDVFLSKIVRSPVSQLGLALTPPAAAQEIYQLDDAVYTGSEATWVGEYLQPAKKVAFEARALRDGAPLDATARTAFPVEELDHPGLPRLWAQARVNALLEEIARNGETGAAVDEIIRLSRKYKFVTPYTSFLAVPRALLRPRVIRPGDPVLRVHTDPSIVSVIALFPFGLTTPLRYLSDDDVWQTRFLAPVDMKDGTYSVRLILRDKRGNIYREAKTFVIASTPPTVKISLDRSEFHRGQPINIKAGASASTRDLIAHIDGAAPVSLRWNPAAGTNTGTLTIPPSLPPGEYKLTVTAEDIAHNLGTGEVPIEVLP
jgi:Ca-activated chloride channel family protein